MNAEDTQLMLSSGLPKIPTKANEKSAIEYVSLVYDGMDKVQAYKTVFPDRHKRYSDKAKRDRRDVRATLMFHITQYESGKYVSSLYEVGSENYFTKFVDKKTRLLNKMYDVGMDEEESMRNRLVASKIFLSSIPEAKKDIKVNVEVDVKNEFAMKLANRQKQLYNIANNENDILDAEVE